MATIIRDDGGDSYETRGGILVTRTRRPTPYADAISSYIDRLDERRGAVFSSNYEYPGRYTRWDTAIIDPPLGISCFGRKVWIEAYNGRGEVLLSLIADAQRRVDGLQRRLDAMELDEFPIEDGPALIASWKERAITEKRAYLRRMIHRVDALPGTAPTEERLRITPVE
mgnify:CR=1 FL=1